MSGTPKFEAVIERLRRTYLDHKVDDFSFEVDPFDSPIEKVMVAALMAHGAWQPVVEVADDDRRLAWDAIEASGLTEDDQPKPWFESQQRVYSMCRLVCVTQHWLRLRERRIKPDFAFMYVGLQGAEEKTASRIIVELDGHDFHERTPEQAQSDKSRDRELQAMGWHVLRFTGREVLRDPENCLSEVMTLLLAKASLERQRQKAEAP